MKKIKTITGIALLSLLLTTPIFAASLTRQLELGMSGGDVSDLQTFLTAQGPSIYPSGLVTGYFGSLTKAAVARFQASVGISAIGRVGPQTLDAINSRMGLGGGAPTISNVVITTGGTNRAIHWTTNKPATGVVYYSSSPLAVTESLNDVFVSGANSVMTDTSLKTTQDVTIPNLSANTRYYYMIYSKDAAGNVSVSWPTSFVSTY